jgi:ABC-type lipoprotein export system ATPase subunit
MLLKIERLLPTPLASRADALQSEIWKSDQVFEPQDIVFLRAPSGKGKSTFMHMLYGLRNDYSGKVYWSQQEAQLQSDAQWAEWRSGPLSIVFQDLRLFDSLTVAENIQIKQALAADVTEQQVKEWLAYLGLEQKWNQKAQLLSYGERQRVALMRSLIQPFEWLLLDEPFSHLDNDNIIKCAEIITQRVATRKAGMMVVDLELNTYFSYTRTLVL